MINLPDENAFIKEDILELIEDNFFYSEIKKDSCFLITGATGLVGSLIIKTLFFISEARELNLKIFCIFRDQYKFEKIFSKYKSKRTQLISIIHDLTKSTFNVNNKIDYVIHCASNTSSESFVNEAIQTINTNILGVQNLINSLNNKVKSIVYVSTMEVYGSLYSNIPIDEKKIGKIDLANIRNSYPLSKQTAELLCHIYAKVYNYPIKIVRPTLIFGPGVSISDNRVFMIFTKSVINSKNIILNTSGNSKRDYIYTIDAVKGILSILLFGKNQESYNLSNPETFCSINELAYKFMKYNPNIKLIHELNQNVKLYPTEQHIVLDNTKRKLIYDFKMTNLETMIHNLICYYKSLSI